MAPIWSTKRERQFDHIKRGLLERGQRADVAAEIAARTVNKGRALHGESSTASPESLSDLSSARRGGLPSHTGARGPTKRQLYGEARRRNIPGRSVMTKRELQHAIARD
jgi:hypothetical protein